MNKIKRIVATAIALCMTAAVTFAVGCQTGNNPTSNRDPEITAVYNAYVAYAEESGEQPLSYEEWYANLLANAKGATGATGATGADGKSAYDIAKDNGFEGTVEQWLESLHGADGADGTNGTNGTDGTNGKDGVSPKIEIGENGNWYIDGVDTGVSSKGATGATGATGADGKDGVSPQITIDPQNYNWVIDGVDTGVCSKGQNGDNGQNGVSVKGIYETSEDYYVVEFSDGTIVPLTKDNENVAGELIKLGKHDIQLNAHTGVGSTDGSKKRYYFYLVVEPDDPLFKGLRIKVYNQNIGIESVEFNREELNGGSAPKSYPYVKNNTVADGTDDFGSYWSKTVATWEDIKDNTGTGSPRELHLKNNILCGYVMLSNTSRTEAVDSYFVIERVTE